MAQELLSPSKGFRVAGALSPKVVFREPVRDLGFFN
jgi:hypothetical protein